MLCYVNICLTRVTRNGYSGNTGLLNGNLYVLIPYTIEYENEHKEQNFLDVTIKNNLNQSYDFAVHRKPAITNVQIKPHSNICPNIAMGIFKGFLSRALHICSENYFSQEVDFFINVFAQMDIVLQF